MTTSDLLMLSDDELLGLVAAGDRPALEALFERHAPMAVSYACSLLGNRDDAFEVAQTALLQLARELAEGRKLRPFKACLYTCVHQSAGHLLAQNAARRRREKAVEEHNARKEAVMPSSPIERTEDVLALREELAALPAETASLLALYHLDGSSVGDIAGQLELSVDACKQRLVRGRELLRERLEKRGVTLASLAFVSALLDQGFASGKAQAHSETAAIATMARHAAAKAVLVSTVARAGAGSSFPIQTAGNSAAASAQVARPDSALRSPETTGRARSMIKKASVAIACCCLLGTVAWVASRSVSQQPTSPKLTTVAASHEAQPAAAKTNGSPVAEQVKAGEKAASRAAVIAPRWQPPRFVPGNFEPRSISTCGDHVMLLAADSDSKKERLVLIESRDGGESWNQVAYLDGYKNGTAELDATGCSILGMVGWEEQTDKDGFPTNRGFSCARIEYRHWTEGKGFSDPQPVWESDAPIVLVNGAAADESPRSGFVIQWAPRLIGVEGGMWAFALRQRTIKGIEFNPKLESYAVAFIPSDGVPKPLSLEAIGQCEYVPSAWARDKNNAGVVLVAGDGHKVRHFTTADGGNSWQAEDIPFALPEDSGAEPLNLFSAGMVRDGERLALVLNTQHWESSQVAARESKRIQISRIPGGISSTEDEDFGKNELNTISMSVEQTHLLLSNDSGKTWALAALPTERESISSEHGPVSLLASGPTITLCHDQNKREIQTDKMEMKFRFGGKAETELREVTHSWPTTTMKSVSVRGTVDGGQTWARRNLLDDLGSEINHVVMGGDANTIHIAVAKQTRDGKCLVIRSYRPADWKLPGQIPSWYKTETANSAQHSEF